MAKNWNRTSDPEPVRATRWSRYGLLARAYGTDAEGFHIVKRGHNGHTTKVGVVTEIGGRWHALETSPRTVNHGGHDDPLAALEAFKQAPRNR